MAEAVHSQSAAQSAAQNGSEKERSLRDAPGTPDGSFFIYAHESKANYIDDYKVEHE